MADRIYNKKYRKVLEIGQGAYGKINLAELVDTSVEDHEGDYHFNYVALKKLMINVRGR